MRYHKPFARSVYIAVAGVSTLAVIVGCSSSGSSSSNSSNGNSSSTSLQPLTVAVASAVVEYSPIYLAQSLGYFAAEGLKVTTIDNVGPEATDDVIAQAADLEMYAPAQSILTRSKGQDLKIIYQNAVFEGQALLTSTNITSLAELQALKSCRLATPPAGTGSYYAGSQFIARLGLHCTHVTSATSATLTAGLASGAYQAIVNLYPAAVAAVNAKQATMIVDPSQPAVRTQYDSSPFPYLVTSALASVLTQKRDSVVAFLRALNKAADYIQTNSPDVVAAQLLKSKAFAGSSEAVLAQGIKFSAAYLPKAPSPGVISSSEWSYALTQYPNFGIAGLSASMTSAQYGQQVDMSFATAALKG